MTKDAAAAYIVEQTPEKRALLETLRALVTKAVPDADVSIKWGVPVYARGGRNICALATFKDHVALNLLRRPRSSRIRRRSSRVGERQAGCSRCVMRVTSMR